MSKKSRLLLIAFSLCLLTVSATSLLAADPADLAVVTNATDAYAYNPNPPYDVIALVPGSVIPDGWHVYLSSADSELTLQLADGQSVTLSEQGYFDVNGQPVTLEESVQNLVAGKADFIEDTKAEAGDLEAETQDVSNEQSLDDPLRVTSPT